MAQVLSWQKVEPRKRIVLSKRLSTSVSDNSSQPGSGVSITESGDFRRNKIFPADSEPDLGPVIRLKDALSFSYSVGDSDIGTSVSQSGRQSSIVNTKSSKTSRKASRCSVFSEGNNSFSSNPVQRERDIAAVFTIEGVEVRENEENSSSSSTEPSSSILADHVMTSSTAQSSSTKYIIKKDHNHRKDRQAAERKTKGEEMRYSNKTKI